MSDLQQELQDAYEEIRRLSHELGIERQCNVLAFARIDALNGRVNRGVATEGALRDQIGALERDRDDARLHADACEVRLMQHGIAVP